MKTTLEKVYQCEYCFKKKMRSAGAMSRHEKFCTQNPNTWHKCFDYCSHLIKTSKKVASDYYDEGSAWKTEFTCNVNNKKLYSFKLEKTYPQYIEIDSERMPLECTYYKQIELPF